MAADSAMEQITTALSEASLRKGETERLKEDLAVNEKATQSRKGDIEQVRKQMECEGSCICILRFIGLIAAILSPSFASHHVTSTVKVETQCIRFLGLRELLQVYSFGCEIPVTIHSNACTQDINNLWFCDAYYGGP